MFRPRLALALSLAALAGGAHALTLGELVDRGAQRLTPAEAAIAGPLQVIRESADSDARMTLHPDGTVSGTVLNKQGHGTSEAAGATTLDAAGKRCVAVDLPAFRMQWKECGYAWRLDGQLYHVASDTDRAAPATPYLATAILRP
jgi:hypothetical protein